MTPSITRQQFTQIFGCYPMLLLMLLLTTITVSFAVPAQSTEVQTMQDKRNNDAPMVEMLFGTSVAEKATTDKAEIHQFDSAEPETGPFLHRMKRDADDGDDNDKNNKSTTAQPHPKTTMTPPSQLSMCLSHQMYLLIGLLCAILVLLVLITVLSYFVCCRGRGNKSKDKEQHEEY